MQKTETTHISQVLVNEGARDLLLDCYSKSNVPSYRIQDPVYLSGTGPNFRIASYFYDS